MSKKRMLLVAGFALAALGVSSVALAQMYSCYIIMVPYTCGCTRTGEEVVCHRQEMSCGVTVEC